MRPYQSSRSHIHEAKREPFGFEAELRIFDQVTRGAALRFVDRSGRNGRSQRRDRGNQRLWQRQTTDLAHRMRRTDRIEMKNDADLCFRAPLVFRSLWRFKASLEGRVTRGLKSIKKQIACISSVLKARFRYIEKSLNQDVVVRAE